MNNKVLIKLYVPSIDNSFDLFIPVNEVIWKIISLAFSGCLELSGLSTSQNRKFALVNKHTNEIYSMNSTIYESNIRNGTELILLIM